ncbi:MAG: hypothetical protein OEM32_06730, partial [Acidimicrobiia bacterium]|nr:hypothetical protein [Acidimicrobiia bacterium]
AAGWEAELLSLSGKSGRIRNLFRALAAIGRVKPDAVILPDPELFVLGSLWARLRGVRAVIDVHENYGQAAVSRAWIPKVLKPMVGAVATINDRLGRKLADSTIVAASELGSPGSHVVLNIPDPSDFVPGPVLENPKAVYVGDVTVARGAIEIAELARAIPEVRILVIGPASEELKREMKEIAGPNSDLELAGKLPHQEAWDRARGSLAGLSLLRPFPAYREAVATKLWEYCAAGLPPVVTDLPGQRRFVSRIDPDLVGADVAAITRVLRALHTNEGWRQRSADAARALAIQGWDEHRPDLAIQRAVKP